MVEVCSADLGAFPHCLGLIIRQVVYGFVDLNQQTAAYLDGAAFALGIIIKVVLLRFIKVSSPR